MARINLENLAHSYDGQSYALKPLNHIWEDGKAYALLGPSGCGKTTLLNVISGLLFPSDGKVWFDETDVTQLQPQKRNIAQVFQFPVLYDTMSVYENLAFPLKNRGWQKQAIDQRVREIAKALDIDQMLDVRAAGLGAEAKQTISLGRGLVRPDVAAILFDEPLTVIDPHLKWRLRRRLKAVHATLSPTMVYVTHDQVEALTFADRVVVMLDGQVLQIGTPQELFEKPAHTFVGYFIGSPGMNFLPCQRQDEGLQFTSARLNLPQSLASDIGKNPEIGKDLVLGARPEHVEFMAQGQDLPEDCCVFSGAFSLSDAKDLGNHLLVTVHFGDQKMVVKRPYDAAPCSEQDRLIIRREWLRLYQQDLLVYPGTAQGESNE